MKQEIDGKIYDTETASFVAKVSWKDGNDWRPEEIYVGAYRSPDGEYFVAGPACVPWSNGKSLPSRLDPTMAGVEVISTDHARSLAEMEGLDGLAMRAAGFNVDPDAYDEAKRVQAELDGWPSEDPDYWDEVEGAYETVGG